LKTQTIHFRKIVYGLVILFSTTLLIASCQKSPQTQENALDASPSAAKTQALPNATNTQSPTPTASPIPTATLTPAPTVVKYGPSSYPEHINPLTGQAVTDPELLARSPVLVKVSNFPREGRPHAGLSYADIVFDYYIGEGTNRLLALYYGQNAPKVGPIRSARLVDAQLTQLYQGILGYAGADYYRVLPVINRELGNRAFSVSAATCPALCDDGPHTVFSVFADTGLLSKYAQDNWMVHTSQQ